MEINASIRDSLDAYYHRIHINDFSSFIKSDFRDDQLFDLSEERAERNIAESRHMLEQIAQWQASGALSYDESVILDVAADFCRYIIRNGEYYWYKFNLTHNTTPLPYVVKRLETYPLQTQEALERYVMLLSQFPDKLAQMLDKLKEQERRNIVLPEEQCSIVVLLLESLLQTKDSLLCPWNRSDVDVQVGAAQREQILAVLEKMNHTLEGMATYIRYAYHKTGAPVQPGLCHIPGGLEYYRQQIITYTSYDLEPQELHAIGLRELERTRDKMLQLIRQMGLDMDIPQFQNYLRQNRICFDDSVEQLQARFDRVQARIGPKLDDYFLRKPKAGCRSQALPKSKEATTSWGYYSVPIGTEKQGVFYYSGAELDKRSQIRTAAIVAHELLPGHHFQTNLIAEDQSLPELIREHFNTAFADGWAEYAADLVGEMGVYDLYDWYGRYVWDMVLCCRLVVDTGMNALGWPIEKARAFMRENTFLTDSEIFTETLRYSVDMPAQALAYKFGSLKMHELRERAQRELGDQFDYKEYHEVVLRYGSAPLNILEKNVEHFIQSHK